MSAVFFGVSMSLDGFIAPEGVDLAHVDDSTHKDWLGQWMAHQHWMFRRRWRRS